MSTSYSLFKGRLHNILVLASLVICLGTDSCSQCKNSPIQELDQKPNELPSGPLLQIVPLSKTNLGGKGKTIQCKLQQARNSEAIDLAKLQLKIATVVTPANSPHYILYNNTPVSKLSGKQVGIDQPFELIVDPMTIAVKIVVTLQIFYEGKPVKGETSKQTFAWQLMNDVTMKLFEAIRNNNKEEAIALLSQGDIQADARNQSGETLLREAIARNNDPTVIEKLTSVPGMDLNANNAWSEDSPLEWAINENQLDAFKLLLKKGAQTNPGTTILHVAIRKNKINFIKYILDNYDNLKNDKDKDGNTPLHLAILGNFSVVVKLLLDKGANRLITNKAGETPLDLAKTSVNVNIKTAFGI